MQSRLALKPRRASSAAELLDVRTDGVVRLLPAGIDLDMGSWAAAERGAYMMIPRRSVMYAGKCRPPKYLSYLRYITYSSFGFGCYHTRNDSFDNERERPRSNDPLPCQHFHPPGCLVARLLLQTVYAFATRQSSLPGGCVRYYCNGTSPTTTRAERFTDDHILGIIDCLRRNGTSPNIAWRRSTPR